MLLLVACLCWQGAVLDARPERAYFPVKARFGNSREGEHKNVLKYLFVEISGFMSEQIRVVQVLCLPSARRSARYIDFVKSCNWFDCVPMVRGASARGVFVLVTRRFDGLLWRGCFRVRACFEMS